MIPVLNGVEEKHSEMIKLEDIIYTDISDAFKRKAFFRIQF